MKQISIEQIKLIHSSLVKETGGSDGIRDIGLLESAMYLPFQTFDGEPLYPSIQQKASKLCVGLIQNHPFVDGNKRIGIHTMLIFLAINGIDISYTQSELVQVGLEIANGKMSDTMLVKWIIEHERNLVDIETATAIDDVNNNRNISKAYDDTDELIKDLTEYDFSKAKKNPYNKKLK